MSRVNLQHIDTFVGSWYSKRAISIQVGGLFEIFHFHSPRCQLDHPHPKVGIVDVQVVGDTPHNYQVHLKDHLHEQF